jgi:hypothetical protein
MIRQSERRPSMVIEITPEELIKMKGALLDEDGKQALSIIKEFVKRIEQQKNAGMKSHLGG